MKIRKHKYPKRPRIKEFSYEGCFAYFITTCTAQKMQLFISDEAVDLVLRILLDVSQEFGFQVYAYCFMPDHLHMLVLAGSRESSLRKFLKIFKQKTGYYFKQRYGDRLWQPSFYDHVVRKKEHLDKIAGYIFNNPVKAGLVEDFHQYPYLGSMPFEM